MSLSLRFLFLVCYRIPLGMLEKHFRSKLRKNIHEM
ncbi:hypothetical protein [Rhodobacteraceae phage LS06-2018-MD06]|nr:hypothetical protein [Rhodobacteraceae phage LS06-2018-MD06]